MKKIITIVALLVFIASASMAQQSYKKYRKNLSHTGIRSIGMTAGMYFPKLDYYKNRTGFDFKGGSFIAGINGEYWVMKPISVRAGASFFSTTAKTAGTATFNEEMTIGLIPINVDVMVNFSNSSRFSKSPPLTIYGGLGVDLNMINVKYKSTLSSKNVSGQFTSYHVILGADYGSGIRIGPELQYAIGEYSQNFLDATDQPSTQKVSMSGLKFMVKVSYDL